MPAAAAAPGGYSGVNISVVVGGSDIAGSHGETGWYRMMRSKARVITQRHLISDFCPPTGGDG